MSRPPGVRALGIDLGSKRIGIAVSDISGTIASALTTVHRSSSRRHDHAAIAKLVRDEEAEQVVVGLPLSLEDVVIAPFVSGHLVSEIAAWVCRDGGQAVG